MVELVWKGKYDDQGKKVAPVKVQLPLQTIETINESSQERQNRLERFISGRETPEWRNRLIWGDKKYVLPSLLPEFAGKVNLIYIDPPFNTGADFSFNSVIPDSDEIFTKQPSVLEQKAFRDTWGEGTESFAPWLYETIVLLHDLLAEDGSIYVHLDEHADHVARLILDEVFPNGFRNEIAWKSTSAHSDSRRYGSNHQTILFYTKGEKWTWNTPKTDYDQSYVDQYYRYKDPDGRRFKSGDLSAYGLQGAGYTYEWHGHRKLWRLPQESMEKLDREGRVFYTKNGVARLKSYYDESEGMPVQTIWADKSVQYVVSWGDEKLPYETQKSEGLLKRIIETSSNSNDLVLDCFVGSGTTAAVAEKTGRRWIVCDLGRFSIHTTRKRLLSISGIRPFVIQNLGKYERQAWQATQFGNQAAQRIQSYTDFVVKLYGAQPMNGYAWIHGKKGNRLLHVGAVDSPVSPLDVGQIVAEFKRMVGGGKEAPKTNGVDVLGWDFAFEINELAKQQAAQSNVDVRFLRIPREVLDKKAVEQGDIHFFELASLDVKLKVKGKTATVAIKDFAIPQDDVPADVQKQITHWSQWIDYWAVDWDNKSDTFHNEVQEYRTRDKPKLATELSKEYEKTGNYRVLVKVVDILGNDTTKLLEVKV